MQPAKPQQSREPEGPGGAAENGPKVDAVMRATARRAAWFFLWSLAFALTLGTTLGTLLWLSLTWQKNLVGSLPIAAARVAHGYAQLFGFTALFVCGVAYHVLPRLSGRPWQQGPIDRIALVGLATGTAVGAVGALLQGTGGVAVLLAHGALFLGAAAFTWSVATQLRGSAVQPPLLSAYVQMGCWWLVATAGVPLLFPDLLAQAQPVVWEAALWGFVANWIYGMSLRILPASLGLQRSNGPAARALCATHQLGVLLWCLGIAATSGWIAREASFLGRWGGLMLAAAGFGFIHEVGLLRGRGPVTHAMPGTEKFLWTAYLWLALALALGPVAVAVTGSAFVGPRADFARHAFTLGFLTQMIFGVSMRVLPTAAGIPIWSNRLRDYTYGLLNAGALLRAGEAITAWGGSMAWYRWSALSGPVAWAAFVLFALNLIMSVRHGQRATRDQA